MRAQRISGIIVDVLNRTEFPGTIEVSGGVIRRIVRDARPRGRRLLLPGFVDAHIHIESSLLPPAEFARHAVVHGTVGTVSDPHEIANVLGEAGVRYMIADARRTPFRFTFGAPSCVPATVFETAGARLGAKAVARLLRRKDVGFLAEVMNFPGVLGGDPELHAMIAAARELGKPVDGHAPGLRGESAANYAVAGITTDHECFTLPEARDKLAAGMQILIREGSAAKNFAALAPLLRTDPARCMFCCDDLHPDLLMRRHLDEHVRRALKLGADRYDVLACASVNPVKHYGLEIGLLRAGDRADFIEVESWRRFVVRRTWLGGKLVAAHGRTLLPRQPARIVNKFRARPRQAQDFAVPALPGKLNVIEALNGQLVTRWSQVVPKQVEGAIVSDVRRDILKIAVVNRYRPLTPVAVGFVRGFGLKSGALASSVAHDSHNVVAVGADDDALAAAVNLVISHRGGLSAVGLGRRRILPLPIAGLMSDADGRSVARRYTELDRLAKRLGSRLDAPFMTLSFMALLVIPDLKLSDRGLFSGRKWGFVPLAGRSLAPVRAARP
ncbi:MAG: adenine deaminase [Verrucomicrobia bacterium]|nr:adenine deaminase [Verrucomicrobiota bacterium]